MKALLESGALDWGALAPLRLRARSLSLGLYTGAHRSLRRGSGIEFGGHRDYVPGDDLRRLDHRALMRHGKLLVREFETDTDRSVQLVVDRTASMGFKSERAPGAKLAYSSLLAAALGRIALSSGDPVSLDWLGKSESARLPVSSGREAFERLLSALELVQADARAPLDGKDVERQLWPLGRGIRRGSVVVVLSDSLDLPAEAKKAIVGLAGGKRTLVVVQVLDPVEVEFPYQGTVRLRASETSEIVETDAHQVRRGYLAALHELADEWRSETERRGGVFVPVNTAEPPLAVLGRIITGIGRVSG